jgi:hypothetical protein
MTLMSAQRVAAALNSIAARGNAVFRFQSRTPAFNGTVAQEISRQALDLDAAPRYPLKTIWNRSQLAVS